TLLLSSFAHGRSRPVSNHLALQAAPLRAAAVRRRGQGSDTLFAQLQQVSGERTALREQGAQVDVPHQSEGGIHPYRGARRLARQRDKPFPQRLLPVRERRRIAESPQALFRDVADEVADVQRRIPLAVKVEVDEVKTTNDQRRTTNDEGRVSHVGCR